MNARQRKKVQERFLNAAGFGSPEQLTALLRSGADPNLPDRSGTTPLYLASVQGAAGNVRVLLAAGAMPNTESGDGSEGLPLCGAAVWGHDDSVRELLLAGADPNLREDGGSGRTASEWALVGGHRSTLALLRAFGARAD
ncbi:ankyrin repeat domain-containing protein [Micromonospora vulcania]|uniref:Ankyrin repeat domain-containing protein n=1 Tax=Micromonospora vulcania TaxID=1441873 RepID=A0ABW1HC95_9ACTN